MTDRLRVITHSGRHVLTGNASKPRSTSFAKGWRGVALEFFGPTGADFVGVFDNHGIAVPLGGCVDLFQQFDGKVSQTQMRRGNITISPARTPKRFQYPVGAEFVVVHITPALLSQVAEEVNRTGATNVDLLNSFCTRDSQLERLAHQLCNEYWTQDIASGLYAESLANQLAIHLLRNYSTARRIALPPPSKLTAKALKVVMDYIEANLPQDLTLGDIAKLLSMSAGHFAHAFRNTTGISPHRYVIERRIEAAKAMLRDTDLAIATVATTVGFSTHSHFCTTFHKVVGKTPRSFRGRRGA